LGEAAQTWAIRTGAGRDEADKAWCAADAGFVAQANGAWANYRSARGCAR